MNAAQRWLPCCGAGPAPSEWFARWNFAPVLLALVAISLIALWYLALVRRRWNVGAALTVLVLFVSPVCALGSSLFTVRVIHHAALALVLAPLLVRSLGLDKFRFPGSLTSLTALQAAVLWIWHIPQLYEAALSHDGVFWLMQASLTATAALWWARLRQAPAPAAVVAVLATMVQMGVLGALLTFAGRAFYAPHWLTVQAWGLTPLEDQQIAGLIMWAPASAAYLAIALAILYRDIEPARGEGAAAA